MASRPTALEEFFKTVEWQRLSPRQKMWLETYLASGRDQQLATNCSYETSGSENARTFSYQVARQKKIQAALNRYFNKGPREIFLDQVQADIKASRPGSIARARLRKLEAELLGLKKSKRGATK